MTDGSRETHALLRTLGSDRYGRVTDEGPLQQDGRPIGYRLNTTGGAIVWSADTGAHEVHGDILAKWLSLDGPVGFLGFPHTDETGCPDGVGRFNHFTGGSIYWTPDTGAREVHGDIRERWKSLSWERGLCGYPTSDEIDAPAGAFGAGRVNHFQNADIYWSPISGAHEVHGAILDRYNQLGASSSALGFPVTNERPIDKNRMNPAMFPEVPAQPGSRRFSVFCGGIIHWTPRTGPRESINDDLGFVHTAFRPRVDGFAFSNSFQWDARERDGLRAIIDPIIHGILDTAVFPIGLFADAFGLGNAIRDKIVADNTGGAYGLCGGMAFLALDHFRSLEPLQRGKFMDGRVQLPMRNTPQGTHLRDQIWDRLKDSLVANGGRFVEFILQILTDAHGAKTVTASEWDRIKTELNSGRPVPVGLIGTSISPMDQHQVLAFDYDDNENGTGVLYLYEPNGPDRWQTIAFDLNGQQLSAWESCYTDGQHPAKGPLRAFFLEEYQFRRPPGFINASLRVSAGLSHAVTVPAGQRVPVTATLTQNGFGDIVGVHMEAEAPAGAFTTESLTGAFHIPFQAGSHPVLAVPAGDRSWPGHLDLSTHTVNVGAGHGWDARGEAPTGARPGVGTYRFLLSYGAIEGVRRRKIATGETVTITTI